MDPLLPLDEGFSSAPTDAIEMERKSPRARRKKSTLSCRRFCGILAILVILIFSAGFVFLMYTVAKSFHAYVSDPHHHAFAKNDSSSVIKSYYGEHAPRFDVVANVYIRFGKELAVSESEEINVKSSPPSEQEIFGEWESIFSQTIYSNMEINSTTKVHHKTVNLSISQEVLSRMYQPHTYFPQIVNTFVVVPTDPDPALSLSHPPALTVFNSTRAVYPDPALTSWTQSSLRKLSRPIDLSIDTIEEDETSRWRNVSASLDTFYDTTVVKEFALRPVPDRWTSWPKLTPSKNSTNLTTTSTVLSQAELDERSKLYVRRNTSVKIKTTTWISMTKDTPIYDMKEYLSTRKRVGESTVLMPEMALASDPLNRQGPRITGRGFHVAGHTASHFIQKPFSTNAFSGDGLSENEVEHSTAFYGPHLSLNGHTTGLFDWVTLPRVNTSSQNQSEDPFVIPWHVAFEFQSGIKAFAVGTTGPFLHDGTNVEDAHPVNAAYTEAKHLENQEFWNNLLGRHKGSSRRPILRWVFHSMAYLIGFPVLFILRVHYIYSRTLSTGISIPPLLLLSGVRFLRSVLRFQSESYIVIAVYVSEIAPNLGLFWFWACLWWGFEFQWGGWNRMLPVGLGRNKLTHSERRSRRVDSQFTWLQRSLLVIVLTACLPHIHKVPPIISATHQYTYFWDGPSSPSSYFGKLFHKIIWSNYWNSFEQAAYMMSTVSQILLNKRLRTFGGFYPSAAWVELITTILLWSPTVLYSIFGKFHTSHPVQLWTVCGFLIKGVQAWQAYKYPVVKQDEEEDE